MITKEMTQAGQDICDHLMSAQVEQSMSGLGGCREFDLDNYPKKYHGMILKYIDKEHELMSVDCIYMAMEMAKENK